MEPNDFTISRTNSLPYEPSVPPISVHRTHSLDECEIAETLKTSVGRPIIPQRKHSLLPSIPLLSTKSLYNQRSALKTYKTPIQKSVKFKSDEFEELCYFSRETPPSHIPLSPVYTTEDDLCDLSAADVCFGQSRTIINLINFFSTTAFTVSHKQSRVASVKLEGFHVTGIIEVRNIAFKKEVTVRYTLDNWTTHEDIRAKYISSGKETLLGGPPLDCDIDQFEFKINVRSIIGKFVDQEKSCSTALIQPALLAFAVKYAVNDCIYWDANNDSNYKLELRRTFIKCKPVTPAVPISPITPLDANGILLQVTFLDLY